MHVTEGLTGESKLTSDTAAQLLFNTSKYKINISDPKVLTWDCHNNMFVLFIINLNIFFKFAVKQTLSNYEVY